MKFELKETPEQIEIVKALGSKNKEVSAAAAQALASTLGPVIQAIINQASTAAMVYKDIPYNEDENPSYPLDLYYGEDVNYVQVWSQNIAGGLPSSQVEGARELKFTTYDLHSAVHFLKSYARKSRLDVVSKALKRMSQEILVKQERNAWAVVLKGLGEASTKGLKHTIISDTQDIFRPNDLSRLMTRLKRITTSFANGTPEPGDAFGLTDLIVSPEIKEQIRAFAWNPLNTINGAANTAGNLGLPDATRQEIFNASGLQEIFGVTIHELMELGFNAKYSQLFSAYATAGIAASAGNFNPASDELLIGIDGTREAFLRPVMRQSDSGGTVLVQPDDQFVSRSEKIGFWSQIQEGRLLIDSRALVALIV